MKMACLILILVLAGKFTGFSQDTHDCKVYSEDLARYYKGECKKGLAHGQGEARGASRYVGSFSKGYPEGQGTYYYDDSLYHIGKFLEGKKEGKGESHYLVRVTDSTARDSIVKGYWSGDMFVGKEYRAYEFTPGLPLNSYEIYYSQNAGTTVRFEITGQRQAIATLFSGNKRSVYMISNYSTSNRTVLVYRISEFPVKLIGTLSGGQTFHLDLYRSADWTVNFNMSR